MSEGQIAQEEKKLKQRQVQLGIILLALSVALVAIGREHPFVASWGIAMVVGLLVELSSLRRMIRLLGLISHEKHERVA